MFAMYEACCTAMLHCSARHRHADKTPCIMCRWRRLTNFVKFQNEQGYFMGPSHWQVPLMQVVRHPVLRRGHLLLLPSDHGYNWILCLSMQPHVDNTPGVLMHEESSSLNPRISVRQHGPFRVGAIMQTVHWPADWEGCNAHDSLHRNAWRFLLRLQMHTVLMQLRQALRFCDDEPCIIDRRHCAWGTACTASP